MSLEYRRLLKGKASVSDEPARKIISEFSKELDTGEQIAYSVSYEADYLAIYRAKAKSRPNYPATP